MPDLVEERSTADAPRGARYERLIAGVWPRSAGSGGAVGCDVGFRL